MFDNPKKELQRLEEQLLAAEQTEQPQAPLEELYLPRQEEPAPAEPEEATPREPNRRVPYLVAALLLEVAALFGVLAWWLLWR